MGETRYPQHMGTSNSFYVNDIDEKKKVSANKSQQVRDGRAKNCSIRRNLQFLLYRKSYNSSGVCKDSHNTNNRGHDKFRKESFFLSVEQSHCFYIRHINKCGCGEVHSPFGVKICCLIFQAKR